MPLFVFGLTGDGSGGADVCIKPRLFHRRCCPLVFCLLKSLLGLFRVLAMVVNRAGPVPGLPGVEFPPGPCPCPEAADKTDGFPAEEEQAGWQNMATVYVSCVLPITSH